MLVVVLVVDGLVLSDLLLGSCSARRSPNQSWKGSPSQFVPSVVG